MTAILAVLLGIWQIAATPTTGPQTVDPEYAALVGAAAAQGQKSPMPRPSDIAVRAWTLLRDPLYVHGANDQGIGIQLGWSLLRVSIGFGLAVLVAIPLGFLIGMSPVLNGALDPIIQLSARSPGCRWRSTPSRTARSPPSSSSSSARSGRCC